MSLVGEQLDPDNDIAGVVVSTRPKIDRIQLWLKASDDVEKINGIAKRLLACLRLQGKEDEGVGLEFQVGNVPCRDKNSSPHSSTLPTLVRHPRASCRSRSTPTLRRGPTTPLFPFDPLQCGGAHLQEHRALSAGRSGAAAFQTKSNEFPQTLVC